MKGKYTLSVLIFLCSLQTFAQSDLIGCYPLDNNVFDYSGYSHDGAAYNLTPDSDRFSHQNSTYNFSGANGGILVSDSAFHLNSYTYSVWCKLSSLPSLGDYYSLIAIGGDVADQSILVGNNPGIGHIGFGCGSWDTFPTPHHCYQGFLPNVNQWYHIVFTRDPDSLKMYIDNNLICFQTTGNNAGYQGPVLAFSIGARIDTLTQLFEGDIDEIKIFDRALTAMEVASLNSSCKYYTGITNNSSTENSISVFPNPFGSRFLLRGTSTKGVLFLYDVLGKELLRQTTSDKETEILFENFMPGIYFIRYMEENKFISIKLIKL